jgi:multidrug efflux pump subunit AcrB
LKRVKGTRDVSTLGGPDHVVRVLMDSERMNAFGVTPQDLRQRCASATYCSPPAAWSPATAK